VSGLQKPMLPWDVSDSQGSVLLLVESGVPCTVLLLKVFSVQEPALLHFRSNLYLHLIKHQYLSAYVMHIFVFI